MGQKSKPTTFTKGMISDNDQRFQEDGSYRDAQNIQLINKNGATFTVENIEGNTQVVDLLNSSISDTDSFNTYFTGTTPAWPFTTQWNGKTGGYSANIVGYYSYKNQLVLIIVGPTDQSSTSTDYRTIFLLLDFNSKAEVIKITDLKVAWETSGNAHPDLNMDPFTSVKIEGIIENECLNRIYFTDNVNPLRTLNLFNKSLYSLTPDELNISPKSQMNQAVLDSLLSGRLPVGVYQYAYKYVNDNGAETGMSPLSNLMHISNQSSASYKEYFGGAKGQLSGDGFAIKISNVDVDYDNIELYALLWQSLDIPPIVAKVAKKSIVTNAVTFKHTSFDNIIENGIEDVLIKSNTWDVCKDIAIKDNILFAANLRQTQNYITEKEWNVPVLRYNHDGTKARLTCDLGEDIKNYYIDVNGDLQGFSIQTNVLGNNVAYSTGAVNIDITDDLADGKGTYNNAGQYSYAAGAHRYLGQEPVESTTGANRHVLGGESFDFQNNQLGGCRVTFALKRKLADTKYNNSGVMTTTTYIDANESAESLETDNIAGNNDPQITTNVINGDTVYRNTMSFSGSKDPQIAGSFRGYQRGEIYRFGVLTYDLNGNPGNVLWIGDLQMPMHYDVHYELDLSRHQLGVAAGNMEIKANSYTQDYRLSISGGELVPALKRHYDDRQWDNNSAAVLTTSTYAQRKGFEVPGSDNENHLFDLHLDFEFRIPNEVRQKISGFRVVRAERNEEDRSIVQQGLYHLSNRYGVEPTGNATDREDGYRDKTNLDETLNLDHIQERIGNPSLPVSSQYDDLLNGYYGLDATSEKAKSYDDTNLINRNFDEGDASDTSAFPSTPLNFINGGAVADVARSHYGGTYEFSWSNNSVFNPSYQFLSWVGTLDSPDSAFGTRPYQYRDGDKLRIDSILKLHNSRNLAGGGNNHSGSGNNATYTDSIQFAGVKETDSDKNSGIIVNKYSVYDTYFNCYIKALQKQNLTVRAYCDQGYTDNPVTNSGVNYYPLTASASLNENTAIMQVDNIINAKEITAGEIIPSSFFERGALPNYNGWSNHTLGYVERSAVRENHKFSILDEDITEAEVNYDNVSTIQTGTRSILIETGRPTILRNIKRILRNQGYNQPAANSPSKVRHYSKQPYKYLCSIVRPNENQYGGRSKDSIYNTLYIVAGNFHKVSEDVNTENHLSRVAGGDTFVNFYSHQKTLSPFSDKSYSTWNVYPVESYVNTDMRSGLHLAAGDTEEGFDLTTPPFTNDWLYNEVYSQENNLQRYLSIEDEGCKFTELPFEVAYSETKLSGETADAFRTFPIFNFHDVEAGYGQINNLFNFQNEIYFIQETGFGKLLVNPRTFIADEAQGTSLFTGTGETIESHTYISTQYGTKHQSSLVSTEDAIYFVDVPSKKIIQFKNNTLSILSDGKGIKNKLDKYLSEYTSYNETELEVFPNKPRIHYSDLPLKFQGISTGYDPINRDVIFTFKAEDNINFPGVSLENHFTIVYNENIEAFTTNLSVHPQNWILHMNKLYTSRRRFDWEQISFNDIEGLVYGSLELWEWGTHPLKYKNNFFYDRTTAGARSSSSPATPTISDADLFFEDSKITHVVSDASLDVKVYDNIQIIMDGGRLNQSVYTTDIITDEQVSPLIGMGNQSKYREGILRYPLRGYNYSAPPLQTQLNAISEPPDTYEALPHDNFDFIYQGSIATNGVLFNNSLPDNNGVLVEGNGTLTTQRHEINRISTPGFYKILFYTSDVRFDNIDNYGFPDPGLYPPNGARVPFYNTGQNGSPPFSNIIVSPVGTTAINRLIIEGVTNFSSHVIIFTLPSVTYSAIATGTVIEIQDNDLQLGMEIMLEVTAQDISSNGGSINLFMENENVLSDQYVLSTTITEVSAPAPGVVTYGPRMRGTYLENTITANTKEKFNIFAILAKYRKSYN